MGEWIPIEKWEECVRLAQPNTVFEVVNAAGESLQTLCVVPLPVPSDWKHPPQRFRVLVSRPKHSPPLPKWRPSR
jgi:hypothetical protein